MAEPTTRDPIMPPATIGILGGGQLGRMLGFAARALGYRVIVLDPDADCPARPIADHVEVAGYDDVDAALRLAGRSEVVTLELEHIGPAVLDALDALERAGGPALRPGRAAVRATQDRLAERRFLDSIGAPVAEWREVRSLGDLRRAVRELSATDPTGFRLKAAIGGYDGRSQVALGPAPEELQLVSAFAALERSAATHGLLLEREVSFGAELSVVVGRGLDGSTRPYPVALNVHDAGILVESIMPAPVAQDVASRARALGARIADGLDLVGVLTAELFLRTDGTLAVNELAPRVHNSGHVTIDAAATSQFEQHVRAICGLPLGSADLRAPAAAMVNLLGDGELRDARLDGLADALDDPDVHVHVYDKRRVFERRKMGHVTAIGATADEALGKARRARAELSWVESVERVGGAA